jgi:hypothetical protein
MNYLATSINESPVITDKAGAVIADVRGKAVKYDGGAIVLAKAGDTVLGVGIMTNDENIQVGADVDIQIKDIGLVCAGAEITKGAELAPNANGAFVTASSGYIAAIALEDATAAGVYIKARLVGYTK